MIHNKQNKILMCDVTSILDQYSRRGIGRYTKEIMYRLVEIIELERGWEMHWIGFEDLDKNLIETGISKFKIEQLKPNIIFHSLGKVKPSNFRNIGNWRKFDRIIDDYEPEIYFAPHFERGLPSTKGLNHTFKNTKTAVFVHDVIPIATSTYSSKNFLLNSLKGFFYRKMFTGAEYSDLVFTNSDFSKADIIKHTNILDKKIHRTYLGVDAKFRRENFNYSDTDINATLKQYNLVDKKYFFYDSGLEKNKGIENLIQVMKSVFEKQGKDNDFYLVITGRDFRIGEGKDIIPRTNAGQDVLKQFNEAGILDKLITTDRFSDEDLIISLSQASFYIYPSEYEGFGFGPAQAMAMQIPAIVNNSSCLPEIVKDAALKVDFKNHKESTSEIAKFINQKDFTEIINKGSELSKNYDWDKTAQKTWDLLKNLVEES